jgi:hypothetical protein
MSRPSGSQFSFGSFGTLSSSIEGGTQKSSQGSQKNPPASQKSQQSQGSQKSHQLPKLSEVIKLQEQFRPHIYKARKQKREWEARDRRKRKLQAVPRGAKLIEKPPCVIYVLPSGTKLFESQPEHFFFSRQSEDAAVYKLQRAALILARKCKTVFGDPKNAKCVDGFGLPDGGVTMIDKSILEPQGQQFGGQVKKMKSIQEIASSKLEVRVRQGVIHIETHKSTS